MNTLLDSFRWPEKIDKLYLLRHRFTRPYKADSRNFHTYYSKEEIDSVLTRNEGDNSFVYSLEKAYYKDFPEEDK